MNNNIEHINQQLVQSIAQGSQEAFEQLYHTYYVRLFKFALNIVKAEMASEDVVSDVFLKLWKGRKNLVNITNIESYLYTSVRNEALSRIKEPNSQNLVFDIADITVEPRSTVDTPEEQAIREELALIIKQTIDTLPPKCRMIFKLAKEDGLKYKEIAKLLGISVRTVDAQLAIAVKKLNPLLRPYFEGKTK